MNEQKLLEEMHPDTKARNPHLFVEPEKKKNKYNAQKTKYNGVLYDSKKEASFAANLDLLVKAGELVGWSRQTQFIIGGVGHRVDFTLYFSDGTYKHVDVKGKDTPEGKRSRKQVKSMHGQDIELR